jgi:hypothetical protein
MAFHFSAFVLSRNQYLKPSNETWEGNVLVPPFVVEPGHDEENHAVHRQSNEHLVTSPVVRFIIFAIDLSNVNGVSTLVSDPAGHLHCWQ